ncbi:cytochrome c nitrite reductase small subunit [Evansella caseinilytica]|uniref:Cytochrome c nitrite reductase small subunit n=1 Tax=Evansella caseinilytica TaxID=1503961 RepID=A0A1H3PD77_9BACI|nr:NapC/NirT family cytochrome c [Evansella caseinilytica]SDY99017.1 cytochrome c nitrite reductase small subunit [Evansella caseinilytica]
MREKVKRLDKKRLLLVLIGVFLGIVVFAGTSATMKATDSGEFCSSCHIMNTAYETFAASNHATLSCNDCHAPRDSFSEKIVFKAKAGMGHVYMNTLGSEKIPDVLHATAESQEVINQNCISCHEPSLQNVAHDVKDSCIDCHRQVPHMNGDFRPAEWFESNEFFFAEPGKKQGKE